MQIKKFLMKHKYSSLIAILFIVIVLLWSFRNSFSETVSDSAWDGIVARSFTSGTGTLANPYVISNASEYAYFKNLLEGEDANAYVNKNYVISKGFNYGEYDISIHNTVPFSGTLDGNGSLIYNASITNSLFDTLEDATIKNISFGDITYSLTNETGALLANDISNSNIDMVLFSGNVSVDDEYSFGGFVYTSSDNNYSNIVLNYDVVSESDEIYSFAYELDSDEGNNILIKKSDYEYTNSETDIVFTVFELIGDDINLSSITNLDEFVNDDYKVIVNNNQFVIEAISKSLEIVDVQDDIIPSSKAPNRSVVATDTITEHATGVSGTTVYINDFVSDYNYYKGLNFTEIRSTSIPSGISTGYYDDGNLVKVEIIYDGTDINNSSLVGAMSPISGENINQFVYFKYYALERTSSGTLATNSNNDNYIRIELIDNPFSKRPYVNSTEYGFNGWVCNQQDDTTTDLCENATFSFNVDNYTRYLDIPVAGGSEIIVHLNASWYKADVITSSSSISSFNSMQMELVGTVTYTTETITGKAYWNNTYYTMQSQGTVSNNNYMDAGTYYKTNQNGTTYTYNRNRTRCRNTTCYVYSAINTEITEGLEYTGGSVTFVPNYTANSNLTTTTISTYNATYMNLVEDASGSFTETVQVPYVTTDFTSGDTTSGFYYKVSSPTAAMIETGEYYSSDGTLCTNASNCTTAYKLIQYNDGTNNSNNNAKKEIKSEKSKISNKIKNTNNSNDKKSNNKRQNGSEKSEGEEAYEEVEEEVEEES